ncbi:MAG: DedA family protein [Gammaproteobacteria bacterium]|nr:DedA family protein [Gammaproteobacteria bacterium]
MSDWVIGLVEAGSYWGIVLLMTIENVFPPIPSELIMPLAGYLAAQDHVTLWGAVLAGTAGSVFGALPLYWLGARIGSERIKRFADRHGRWLTITRGDLERAEHWFDRRGWLAVFVCRLIPGIRSLISIPAGVRRMNMALFLLVTTVGTGMWAALLGSVGYFLGRNYQQVERYVGWVSWAVIGALVAWYVIRVVRHPSAGGGSAEQNASSRNPGGDSSSGTSEAKARV